MGHHRRKKRPEKVIKRVAAPAYSAKVLAEGDDDGSKPENV
jgi:hypothetical protein